VPANSSLSNVCLTPQSIVRMRRAFRRERFDVVHVHEPLAPGPPMTTVLMRPAPLVGTFHAAGRSSSYVVFRPLVRWIAARIDRKFVVSKDALELAQSHLGGEYSVLFNGVEVEDIAGTAPTPTTNPTIFFLGRHEERKGLAVLLRAFQSMPEDVRLWIGGDGPDSPQLRDEYRDDGRITWLGRISDPEKGARLRGASVICAPSLHGESFGVVLIEAMAAGTPVVASAIDGYRNVATDGLDALLVPPSDPDALAAALGKVLADDTLAATLSAAGRRRAEAFSMRTLAAEYARIYHELLQ